MLCVYVCVFHSSLTFFASHSIPLLLLVAGYIQSEIQRWAQSLAINQSPLSPQLLCFFLLLALSLSVCLSVCHNGSSCWRELLSTSPRLRDWCFWTFGHLAGEEVAWKRIQSPSYREEPRFLSAPFALTLFFTTQYLCIMMIQWKIIQRKTNQPPREANSHIALRKINYTIVWREWKKPENKRIIEGKFWWYVKAFHVDSFSEMWRSFSLPLTSWSKGDFKNKPLSVNYNWAGGCFRKNRSLHV